MAADDKFLFWVIFALLVLEGSAFYPTPFFYPNGRLCAARHHHLSHSNVENDEIIAVRNRLAADLLNAAEEVGQVGKIAGDDDRRRLDELAQNLKPFSDPQPAKVPLTGTHYLVYSGSDSGPTAGLVGPFVGKVTQFFWNETVYQNRVQFGPVQVSIFGEKKITDDETISVKFYETQLHLGNYLVFKRTLKSGRRGGKWDLLFVGRVMIAEKEVLLRVMMTPKLFILTQPLGKYIPE